MSSGPLVPFDPGKPNVARAHDYALGGKDNFAVDRDPADSGRRPADILVGVGRKPG